MDFQLSQHDQLQLQENDQSQNDSINEILYPLALLMDELKVCKLPFPTGSAYPAYQLFCLSRDSIPVPFISFFVYLLFLFCLVSFPYSLISVLISISTSSLLHSD